MKLAKAPKFVARSLGMAVIVACASQLAFADDAEWYGGVNVGQSKSKIDDARIARGLLGSGFATTSIADDNRDTGYKIFAGRQLNRNFAIEGGYFDLGKFGFTAQTLPAGTLNGTIKLSGFNLDLVGLLPITDRFSAFGRVGVNYAKAKDTFSGTGLVSVRNPNPEKRDTNGKYGFGLQYALSDSLHMRAEVERYRINDAVGNKGDVDLASVGLVYRFGGRKHTPVTRVMAPEPVAIAPRVITPEPVAATPPPAPAPVIRPVMKVAFSADSLFDFDKAIVKPMGKEHLDKFAADLRETRYDVITVVGHADRLGSQAYNMELSTRRAEAVKTYLADSAGIPASKITARGADESQPVTKPGECKGQKATKALIACLQPDRRVEVEVIGTR